MPEECQPEKRINESKISLNYLKSYFDDIGWHKTQHSTTSCSCTQCKSFHVAWVLPNTEKPTDVYHNCRKFMALNKLISKVVFIEH
jgi:hypothetical protein